MNIRKVRFSGLILVAVMVLGVAFFAPIQSKAVAETEVTQSEAMVAGAEDN